mmetsp:Transcript_58445/g.137580  ORF Transcript_58445/g.137580 Transcript_58445/m.137580 type:complete len:222 (-) Transcript_58445:377-1042(-)
MGRLPGGIIDDEREEFKRTAPKHLVSQSLDTTTLPRSPTRTLLRTAQAGTSPGTTRSGRQYLRSSRYSMHGTPLPGLDATQERNKFRLSLSSPNFSLRYPLRKSRETAPRNFVVNLPLKGHYATVPGLNIGHTNEGAVGEYTYKLEGGPSPRDILLGPNPPFRFASPAKKLIGPSPEGMFSNPPWHKQGPPPRFQTWETASNRFISQTMYPMQVLPTNFLS